MQVSPTISQTSPVPAAQPSTARRIWQAFWGTLLHPSRTFRELSQETNLLVGAAPFLIWLALAFFNSLLRTAFHGPQIGTEPMLNKIVFVGGFGYLVLDQEAYRSGWGTAFILIILPIMWILAAGIVQVFSRHWKGKGSFENGLMPVSYAIFVPWVLIQSTSEIIFGVPINLLTGTKFFWAEAMIGEFGPQVTLIWNAFVYGIYSTLTYGWSIALLAIAVQRTQGLSWPKSIITAIIAFFAVVFLFSIFVR